MEGHKTRENLTARQKPIQRRPRGVEWTRWGETRQGCQWGAVDESTRVDGEANARWRQECVRECRTWRRKRSHESFTWRGGSFHTRTRTPQSDLDRLMQKLIKRTKTEKSPLKQSKRTNWNHSIRDVLGLLLSERTNKECVRLPRQRHPNNGHDWSSFRSEIGNQREDKKNRRRENMQDYFEVVARAGLWQSCNEIRWREKYVLNIVETVSTKRGNRDKDTILEQSWWGRAKQQDVEGIKTFKRGIEEKVGESPWLLLAQFWLVLEWTRMGLHFARDWKRSHLWETTCCANWMTMLWAKLTYSNVRCLLPRSDELGANPSKRPLYVRDPLGWLWCLAARRSCCPTSLRHVRWRSRFSWWFLVTGRRTHFLHMKYTEHLRLTFVWVWLVALSLRSWWSSSLSGRTLFSSLSNKWSSVMIRRSCAAKRSILNPCRTQQGNFRRRQDLLSFKVATSSLSTSNVSVGWTSPWSRWERLPWFRTGAVHRQGCARLQDHAETTSRSSRRTENRRGFEDSVHRQSNGRSCRIILSMQSVQNVRKVVETLTGAVPGQGVDVVFVV